MTAKTTPQGFPLVECYRCHGTGAHGPSSVQGGTCFGCGGTGLCVRRGKAAKAYAAFLEAHRRFRTPSAGDVAVGDRIRVRKGDELRTVAALERVLHPGVSSGASTQGTVGGDRPWVTYSRLRIDVLFTFEDGSTDRMDSVDALIYSRAGRVDPAPFLALI